MVKGIGTDIVQIERLAASLSRTKGRLLERILTEAEREVYQQKHCAEPSVALNYFAKRFAAKEAVGKALGSGIGQGVSWQEIEIGNDAIGAPVVRLVGVAQQRMLALGASQCLLSLSDEQDYAVAFVIVS
ncbi:MAG: holo-ACP synthase [Cellvibrionaceae bacterium]|nr:holo-ACP synthase [Cellvibrionaceae bacterium]MCV6625329.1 holo-ACP synthase [Cellvibrionaceae bacterium]